jgi:predicted unusual protein kinase regulating ubiquinone biosynthesis (AarF/ABC1/UbiB family)
MDLLKLFTLLLKYNMPFVNRESCIEELNNIFSTNGAVWQKFAQFISQFGDIIGEDLAKSLGQLCFECPEHDYAYSARIIKDAFGDAYETKNMKMTGSGTISQVYITTERANGRIVAIKVMHPNVKKEIKEACDAYNNAKTSMFFPKRFSTICAIFFDGLKDQLDMKREFKHGKKMREWLQPPGRTNNKFIVPEMLNISKKCLVMSYEESLLAAKIDADEFEYKEVLNTSSSMIANIIMAMILNGHVHCDLHIGNWGIRNYESLDTFQIVLYDF